MLFNTRFWFAALMAGTVSLPAMAGVDEDYALAVKRYEEGDVIVAMDLLRKGANDGHLKSMSLLAEILDRSELDDEAIKFYRKAAERGDPDGMYGLGAMMAAGEGVPAKDPEGARRWIEKAAELGQEHAIAVMSEAYLKGQLGLTEADRDTPQALHWTQLAAEHGSLAALDVLAEAYGSGGLLGVSADAALAEKYQSQADKIRGIDCHRGKKKKKKKQSGC